jgi:hypothetical protein
MMTVLFLIPVAVLYGVFMIAWHDSFHTLAPLVQANASGQHGRSPPTRCDKGVIIEQPKKDIDPTATN